jgi:cyclohexanecarboxylate-CoA ligase
MEFDAVLLAPRRQAAVAAGLWVDRTINDDLARCLQNCPDKVALTAVQVESNERRTFTYREMDLLASRIAIGLAKLGIGKNDIVSVQLPNWWQFTLTYLACSKIGAVINPLMHIFRERELSFMLAHGESKVVIAPKTFRGFDFEAMLQGLRPSLPHLQHIIAVGGTDSHSFEALLTAPKWELDAQAPTILNAHRPSPDDITQLIYTSGTTGEPKGVMHSANTVMANILPYAKRLNLNADDVILMASPMAHQTGFMYGLMMPIMLQASAVLQDVWEPKVAVNLIREFGVSFTMASTPFLTDLARTVTETGLQIDSLKTFLCAGAPIPGPLVEQARKTFKAKVVSAWGMSENGAVTLIQPSDDDERAVNTDGCPLIGVEIKTVDEAGDRTGTGVAGKLLLKACSNFGGYLKRPHLNGTDAEGWLDTGDLARIDERGYVRITGRSKDVIIRGGENIPVVEIEALLYRHESVAQVAIVAIPDERLGERAVAVVVCKPNTSFTFEGMTEFLKGHKVAKTYIPEKLVIRDAMPVTPSGKIQKFKLREMLL